MSKTITRKTTYMSLLEETLVDMFSPTSKHSLINYNELKLIDTDQLQLVNINDLKLIDTNQFRLLNLAILSTFFQYIGALFLTLALGFMVGVGFFAVNGSVSEYVLASGQQETPVVAKPAVSERRMARTDRMVQKPVLREFTKAKSDISGDFAVLVNSENSKKISREKYEGQPVVLGESTVAEPEGIESTTPLNEFGSNIPSCSFTVKDGNSSVKFSSGTVFTPTATFEVCADFSKGMASSYVWGLEEKVNGSVKEVNGGSNCIKSSNLLGVSSLQVVATGSGGDVVSACSLALSSQKLVAVAQ